MLRLAQIRPKSQDAQGLVEKVRAKFAAIAGGSLYAEDLLSQLNCASVTVRVFGHVGNYRKGGAPPEGLSTRADVVGQYCLTWYRGFGRDSVDLEQGAARSLYRNRRDESGQSK